jgi:hypothetical protein
VRCNIEVKRKLCDAQTVIGGRFGVLDFGFTDL